MTQYPPDMAAAARRHFSAAELLNTPRGRADVAGYLYGIAAECAVKAMMIESKLWPAPDSSNRKGNPYYMHFPELRTALRDSLQGRLGTPLVRIAADDTFLSNWSTNMRYAKSESIRSKWIETWASQARDVVGAIGT